MAENISPEDLSIAELERLLSSKKLHHRRDRLRAEGRLVEVPGLAPPTPRWPSRVGKSARPTGAMERYSWSDPDSPAARRSNMPWRSVANRALLALEIMAVIGFAVGIMIFWRSVRELNADAQGSRLAAAIAEYPADDAGSPLIDVVVLPSGHKPPVAGQQPQPGEAGYIPEHLLPIHQSYEPPAAPTPGPEQARRIQIPRLEVDKPIYQGDSWDALKKGVGQHIGSSRPGELGNLVLSAHNDIYGEIFRHLDDLEAGDEIIVHTERTRYTYVVREQQIVEPTDVWVMAPTDHASATLISCYPYLVNSKRIVIFADLAEQNSY